MSYNYNSFHSFSVIDWHAFQDKTIQAIDNEIENNSDDYILNVNEDEYISYLVDKFTYEPLSIDKDSEEVEKPNEIKEDLSQYGDVFSRYGRSREGF